MKIYIVYKGATSSVEDCLRVVGHEVSTGSIASNYRGVLNDSGIDVVIFDTVDGVVDESDVNIVKNIQQKTSVPILLVISGGVDSIYRESMFNVGVDGCVQSPFMEEELFARLNILSRKKGRRIFTGTIIEAGGVVVDLHAHEVAKAREKINLTRIEYGILLHLFLHPQKIVPLNELRYCVGEVRGAPSAVSMHMMNLRRKLGGNSIIRTIPRYGVTIAGHNV